MIKYMHILCVFFFFYSYTQNCTSVIQTQPKKNAFAKCKVIRAFCSAKKDNICYSNSTLLNKKKRILSVQGIGSGGTHHAHYVLNASGLSVIGENRKEYTRIKNKKIWQSPLVTATAWSTQCCANDVRAIGSDSCFENQFIWQPMYYRYEKHIHLTRYVLDWAHSYQVYVRMAVYTYPLHRIASFVDQIDILRGVRPATLKDKYERLLMYIYIAWNEAIDYLADYRIKIEDDPHFECLCELSHQLVLNSTHTQQCRKNIRRLENNEKEDRLMNHKVLDARHNKTFTWNMFCSVDADLCTRLKTITKKYGYAI